MAENRMELFIETLTGTAFELSCSPLETIVSIKAKIQYSEGIPVSQQHLIWKSQELNDDLCLQDYSINDGATLKLVLGMRVGPINTRQVPDTKKLKDLADYVERSSESSGSGGRPLTVLVFYDGDKVHMYTLMEKGECSVSPLSGTMSETSSIASIKSIEDVDQEISKENEATKEKITHIQEQLKTLNLNKRSKSKIPDRQPSAPRPETPKCREDFRLPPIHQAEASTSSFNPIYNSREVPIPSLVEDRPPEDEVDLPMTSSASASKQISTPPSTLNYIANSISSYLLSSERSASQTCSSLLAEDPQRRSLPRITQHRQNTQLVAIDLGSQVLDQRSIPRGDSNIVKHDPSRIRKTGCSKKLPMTSGHQVSGYKSRKFVDLDVWLENRPSTGPDKAPGHSDLEDKPFPVVRLMNDGKDDDPDLPPTNNPAATAPKKSRSSSGEVAGAEASPNVKVLKLPDHIEAQEERSIFPKPRPSEESCRPKRLKKRCSLCSKKTGLATSFLCRCGKNFCASHRYAETHQCTHDYKGEGRRMLQLSNPVVAAPKLPKI